MREASRLVLFDSTSSKPTEPSEEKQYEYYSQCLAELRVKTGNTAPPRIGMTFRDLLRNVHEAGESDKVNRVYIAKRVTSWGPRVFHISKPHHDFYSSLLKKAEDLCLGEPGQVHDEASPVNPADLMDRIAFVPACCLWQLDGSTRIELPEGRSMEDEARCLKLRDPLRLKARDVAIKPQEESTGISYVHYFFRLAGLTATDTLAWLDKALGIARIKPELELRQLLRTNLAGFRKRYDLPPPA